MPTQAERRDATVRRLVDATIAALVDEGYAGTTVKAICTRAGLSQGALFRQFDTRLDLVARAVRTIGERHLAAFADAFPPTRSGAALDLERVVRVIRDVCRTDTHAAWHEVMVAARTDSGLHAAVRQVLTDFEAGLFEAVRRTAQVPPDREPVVAAAVLSVMHMFDSEAVTVAILRNPELEAARVAWAATALRQTLDPTA
jgi:AcrR family transcriptional regulator